MPDTTRLSRLPAINTQFAVSTQSTVIFNIIYSIILDCFFYCIFYDNGLGDSCLPVVVAVPDRLRVAAAERAIADDSAISAYS